MQFIGQKHIMTQLGYILPHLYESGEGMSLLIRGPSGWGKTRMALMICNYLTGGDFQFSLADTIVFDQNKHVHFFDEIHLLKTPEILYPIMDTNEHVIILATNDIAELPEALVNRCEGLIFEAYSQEELHYIATLYLPFNLSVECLDYLIESSGYNPRIIKHTAGKLILVFSKHPELVKSTLEEFKYLLESVFGIKDGMDVMCTRYLEALTNVGGTASLQTISSYTHIDQSTMKYFIEPILLYKNRIRISSRGRSLTTNDNHN